MGNQTAASVRGADLLISKLVDAGVTQIFALSGNQIMPIFDACIDAGIEIIHTRHEAAAVYMAEAYAQVSGKPGVALVTAGAGLGNAVGALFGASESQTPVLLISGDSPVSMDGKGAFQELDQVSITTPVTRLSHRTLSIDWLNINIDEALIRLHEHLPGPAHLAIPVDILNQTTNLTGTTPFTQKNVQITTRPIIDLLNDYKRPLIVCGPLLSNTRQPGVVNRAAEATGIPAVVMESPRGVNDPALGAVKQAIEEADVVICIGKRMDFSIQFGGNSKCDWYYIAGNDEYIAQAQKNLSNKLIGTMIADPVEVVTALGSAAGIKSDPNWYNRVIELVAHRVEPPAVTDGKITPSQLCVEVQKAIDQSNNPVLICDGGEFGQWTQACLSAERRVINGLSGSIGGGVCYGIGAAKALPGSTVFVLSGDGSIGFHLAEFETAVRSGVSFVVVVGNDKKWNAEHQLQLRDYGADRLYACELSDMQYHSAVVAMGGHGEQVTHIDELLPALRRAVDSGVVACIEVVMEGVGAPVVSPAAGVTLKRPK